MSQSTVDSLDRDHDVIASPPATGPGADAGVEAGPDAVDDYALRRQPARWHETSTERGSPGASASGSSVSKSERSSYPTTIKQPAPNSSPRFHSTDQPALASPDKPSLLSNVLATPGVLSGINLSESRREPAFHEELVALYCQRLRLLGTLTMATLPACIIIYAWLLPDVLWQVVPVYTVLFVYALLMRTLVGVVRSLAALRSITLATYASFSMGAAVVIALIGDHNALLYSSHNHIILSALLMPFTVWECGVIATIVVGSLAWAGWWSLPTEQASVYASYLYLLWKWVTHNTKRVVVQSRYR